MASDRMLVNRLCYPDFLPEAKKDARILHVWNLMDVRELQTDPGFVG